MDGPAVGARRVRFSLNGRHHDAPSVARHGVEVRLHSLYPRSCCTCYTYYTYHTYYTYYTLLHSPHCP